MRISALPVYVSLAILAICCTAVAEDKPTAVPDPRLLQKVTIESPNARLHTVLEELSRKSGVAINCGANKRDWQVRDIPVVVCAKDVPLGQLLKTIADTTHLLLSADKIGDIKSYRIWRDSKRQKQLTEYEDKKREWQIAQTKWEWDVASKIKDIPYSDIHPSKENAWLNDFAREPMTRKLSRLIAALGPETLDKVLAGEKLVLSATDAPASVKSIIPDLLRDPNNSTSQHPSDEVLAKCVVVVYDRAKEGDKPWPVVYFLGPEQTFGMEVDRLAGLAPYVKPGTFPKPPVEPTEPEVARPDFSAEVLRTKVKTEKPTGQLRITYGDALVALSKAMGYSIVAENFQGHQPNVASNVRALFGKETSPVSCLATAQYFWKVDTEARMITGIDRHWTVAHQSLVPEAVITNLMDKLDTVGVQFDDVASLAELSPRQMQEWISNSHYLSELGWEVAPCDRPIWQFYNGLSDGDKAMAKSEEGLPLRRFDTKWLGEVFAARNKEMHPSFVTSSFHDDLPTEPEKVAELKLFILRYREYTMPNGIKAAATALVIRGKEKHGPPVVDGFRFPGKDSDYEVWSISGPRTSFPAFSREREAELAKKAAGK